MIKHAALVGLALATPMLLGAGTNNGKDMDAQGPLPEITNPARSAWGTFQSMHPETGKFVREGRIERIYGPAFSNGQTAKESADAFVAAHAGLWGLQPEQLLPIGPFRSGEHIIPLMTDKLTGDAKFQLVAYTPHINGIPVFDSAMRLLVRNEPGFPLVLASVQVPDVSGVNPAINLVPGDLNEALYTRQANTWFQGGTEVSGIRPVIFAGVNGESQPPREAVEFILSGTDVKDGGYSKWKFLTDPNTGAILHSENQILHADVNVQVVTNATDGPGADECHPEAQIPLPHARVTVGGSVYNADVNGNITIPNAGNNSVTVNGECRTTYFNSNHQQGADHTASVTIPSGGSGTLVLNSANNNEFVRSEANIIQYAEQTREFTLEYSSSYPTIANQTNFTCNANISSSCNAYYDGSSINFYSAGGGCGNTGAYAIISHEYGHHMVNTAGSGQNEYGEGTGDVIGVLMSLEPRLGLGFYQGNCASGIRNADNNCTYSSSGCSSCGSAIHSCGQLLSGTVWDIIENLLDSGKSNDIISNIFVNSILLHNGSSINTAITIDFLTLDDDNGNINDGTPNYIEINDACSLHGLPGPDLDFLTFSFPGGLPSSLDPATGASFNVNVSGVSASPVAGSGTLSYRVDGSAWVTTDMSGSGNSYVANIPGAECGAIVDYYVSAGASNGQTYDSNTYSLLAASDLIVIIDDDFDTNQGWTVTNDSTTTDGFWTRGVPEGSGRGAPDSAVSGSNCYSTDNVSGNSDVDGGCTTLVSPVMDASAPGTTISYSRWYDNTGSGTGADPNNDTFVIEVSNNGGASWTNLETIGPVTQSSGGWVDVSFIISDVITPSDEFQIRFSACDLGAGSVVEAAVDLVVVEAVECEDVEVPINDECAGAVEIFSGAAIDFTNVNATDSNPSIPLGCSTSNGPNMISDVWFTYTSACTGPTRISLCGSTDFDDRMVVYQSSDCPNEGTAVLTCSDDVCGTSSRVEFFALEGLEYKVRVGSPDGSSGTGMVMVSCDPVGEPCPGDLNGDNTVDGGDIGLLLSVFGSDDAAADLNGDGVVDGGDLGSLLSGFGPCETP